MPRALTAIIPVIVLAIAGLFVARAWDITLCSAYWTLGLYGWWPC